MNTPEILSSEELLVKVKKSITEYYHALDTRMHGGVASSICLAEIQDILGMEWVQGATLETEPVIIADAEKRCSCGILLLAGDSCIHCDIKNQRRDPHAR